MGSSAISSCTRCDYRLDHLTFQRRPALLRSGAHVSDLTAGPCRGRSAGVFGWRASARNLKMLAPAGGRDGCARDGKLPPSRHRNERG